MNTEQQRAAFEAWHKERFGQIPLWVEEDSEYLLSSVQLRFEAYQAALESPAVQALRVALLGMIETAERVDGWQSFPNEPIEKARAALAEMKAGN